MLTDQLGGWIDHSKVLVIVCFATLNFLEVHLLRDVLNLVK